MINKQREVPLRDSVIEDSFFSPILQRTADITVPDILTKFEHDRGGAIDNYDRVRDGIRKEHAGPEWYDGLTCETVAGISDLLVHYYNAVTDLHLDSYAARIAAAAARDENGYVNTYTQTMEPDHRFGENGGFLRGQHELYNAGCLIEAGTHHYRSTGKTSLLDPAVKFACYLCKIIGPHPKKNMVPAHSLPEDAMVGLYRLFQEHPDLSRRYPEAGDGKIFLNLAEFWIENRGNHCGFPDWEHWEYRDSEIYVKECRYGEGRPCWGEYAQDKVPVFRQETIAGHAVRAVLLFTGVASCAYENDRSDYIETAVRIWDNMALKRMHVTGGVGAIHQDEKFGQDYFLPQDAYLETCAAIGAIFFSHSMYLLTGQAKYADCLETILYNGALAGISHEGNRYSYMNPLISDGTVHRWSWHECPCCPPMDLKLYGRLPQFIYSYTKDSITVNLYISGHVSLPLSEGSGNTVEIRQTGGYPWTGEQKIIFETGCPGEISLRLRIPGRCGNFRILLNGTECVIKKNVGCNAADGCIAVDGSNAADGRRVTHGCEVTDGYAVIRRQFKKGDMIEMKQELPVMIGFAHPASKECAGQAVLRRGPVIYCVEEIDHPDGMDFLIGKNTVLEAEYDPEFLGGAVLLNGTDENGKEIHAIPYYLWDNRQAGNLNQKQLQTADSGHSHLEGTNENDTDIKMKVWLNTTLQTPRIDWNETLYGYVPIEKLT